MQRGKWRKEQKDREEWVMGRKLFDLHKINVAKGADKEYLSAVLAKEMVKEKVEALEEALKTFLWI